MRRRRSQDPAAEDDSDSSPPDTGRSDGSLETQRERGGRDQSHAVDDPPAQASKAAQPIQSPPTLPTTSKSQKEDTLSAMIPDPSYKHRPRLRSPWACSPLTFLTSIFAFVILGIISRSFLSTQLDPKGCRMSMMAPAYAKLDDFDAEHTRFASKYSLYLYREAGIDEDTRVKGIPVLFIPGNAGSYRQVRPFGAEAAYYFHEILQHDPAALAAGKRSLDFFSVDFNEDITAFHGQTLLDQAEYLNDAIQYILRLYHNPHRSNRDPALPDPTSVIILGHSMGGIVARTMLIQPNYLPSSINTIITLSAPHARAPVSFDSTIVKIYDDINTYWRKSYSEQWASKNPLWHVTLVSIAGGGLDTVVPSDYSSLTSIVPETHGFTVFTSSIPHVWTGMDHLAIMWCDQFRKAVIRAIFDVVDVRRSTQTRSRTERMTAFHHHFLTGLEPVVDKQLPAQEPKMLLTLEDEGTTFTMHKDRVVLTAFGHAGKTEAHVMPMPISEPFEPKRFTVLTDQSLEGHPQIEVYFCSLQPHAHGQSGTIFNMDTDLANAKAGSARLSCKSASADTIVLPSSTENSQYAFDDTPPMYYLEYDLADVAEYNFVAIVDRAGEPRHGWLIAEFAAVEDAESVVQKSFSGLLTSGVQKTLPAGGPMVHTIHVPVIHSSLLAYKLSMHQSCTNERQLFRPLLRQCILKPYETKFFPNPADKIHINLHGVSPYITPPIPVSHAEDGLSLQIWQDPSCGGETTLDLQVDYYGSAGKLYMRYRTVFAAFPLLVVALVLRKQFKIYNASGIFISFSESMDSCIRTSLPLIFLALTFMALSLARGDHRAMAAASGDRGAATETITGFTRNELLLGSYDPFFWFLIPLFGTVSVGVCIALNYATLAIIHTFSFLYTKIIQLSGSNDDTRRAPCLTNASTIRRVLTTGILILMITTIIPYQFAYLVLCIVQITTSARALRQVWENRTTATASFHNYTHSLLLLLLWILPINIPVLVVWIHNLSVPYLTPFSSHHNIISILPYILLVETISSGSMIPRLTSRLRVVTNVALFALAVWAAVYGVTWAYTLHYAVNGVCGWLFFVHVLGGAVWGAGGSAVADGPGSSTGMGSGVGNVLDSTGVGKWVGELRRASSARKKRP